MGIYSYFFESINDDFVCDNCLTHYYLRLISKEKYILLKGYCYCGEITIQIEPFEEIIAFRNFKFYESLCNCIEYSFDKKPTKFCIDCNLYFCEDCSKNHKHKNIFDCVYLINKCKFHPNNVLIGFCYHCKKPLCKNCMDIHNNHDIQSMNKLEISKEILEKYEKELAKGFSDMNNLLKMKYGEEMNIYISNLKSKYYFPHITEIDRIFVLTLQILKSLLDLYYYHKSKKTLDYQIINNVLNHINFEIVRLQDKIEKDEKYKSYGSVEFFTPKGINRNININLKINFKDEDKIININKNKNKKIIEIVTYKKLNEYQDIKQVKKLKNGDLALYCKDSSNFIIIHNLISNKYEVRGIIKDFTQIKNGDYLILSEEKKTELNKLLFIIEEANQFKIRKIIKLNSNKTYYKMINIGNNHIALLSFSKKKRKSYLELLNYQKIKYEIITLLKVEIYIGMLLKIGNIIVILYKFEKICKLFFYDIKNKVLQFLDVKMKLTDESRTNIVKIDNEKILLSNEFYGIIINVKTKQIESKIKYFKNVCCFGKVKDYILVGLHTGNILQINFHTKEIYNSFKININCKIINIIDMGNNQFCIYTRFNIYLINYK